MESLSARKRFEYRQFCTYDPVLREDGTPLSESESLELFLAFDNLDLRGMDRPFAVYQRPVDVESSTVGMLQKAGVSAPPYNYVGDDEDLVFARDFSDLRGMDLIVGDEPVVAVHIPPLGCGTMTQSHLSSFQVNTDNLSIPYTSSAPANILTAVRPKRDGEEGAILVCEHYSGSATRVLVHSDVSMAIPGQSPVANTPSHLEVVDGGTRYILHDGVLCEGLEMEEALWSPPTRETLSEIDTSDGVVALVSGVELRVKREPTISLRYLGNDYAETSDHVRYRVYPHSSHVDECEVGSVYDFKLDGDLSSSRNSRRVFRPPDSSAGVAYIRNSVTLDQLREYLPERGGMVTTLNRPPGGLSGARARALAAQDPYMGPIRWTAPVSQARTATDAVVRHMIFNRELIRPRFLEDLAARGEYICCDRIVNVSLGSSEPLTGYYVPWRGKRVFLTNLPTARSRFMLAALARLAGPLPDLIPDFVRYSDLVQSTIFIAYGFTSA